MKSFTELVEEQKSIRESSSFHKKIVKILNVMNEVKSVLILEDIKPTILAKLFAESTEYSDLAAFSTFKCYLCRIYNILWAEFTTAGKFDLTDIEAIAKRVVEVEDDRIHQLNAS